MASEAGGADVGGIGARLRAAREKSGLSLLQAAERLHVDARILEALEAENFAVLGADVYVRGHLRRYAEALGESPSQLQQLYTGGALPPAPDLRRIPRADSERRSSPLLLPGLLLVVGVALFGVFWWLRGLPPEKGRALEGAPPAPAGAGAHAGATAGDRAGPSAVPAPGGAAPAPPPAAGPARTSSAGEAQLAVRFSALSWVEISDAEGQRLLQGLYAAGSARDVHGRAPLRVVLGNAPAVDLEINGQPVALAGLVHRNGSAYLSIDGGGRVSAATPRLAHGD